jgi:hypothetical protein
LKFPPCDLVISLCLFCVLHLSVSVETSYIYGGVNGPFPMAQTPSENDSVSVSGETLCNEGNS